MRQLTTAERRAVLEASRPGWCENTVFKPKAKLPITIPFAPKDMATLKNGEWINDEVVNLYFAILQQRETSNMDLPRVQFFSSQFYPKLAESTDGYYYKNVTNWTARSKVPGTVFSKDLLIIPIHCHGNHWTLAVINIKLKRFEYYDSLRGGPLMVLENLRQSLQVRPSWRWHLYSEQASSSASVRLFPPAELCVSCVHARRLHYRTSRSTGRTSLSI